jgi:hypothetical protein
VYALVHQTEELVNQTMDSLAKAPFNKIRFCVFPKSYDYNHNDPQWYAFEKDADRKWDVHSPCFAFWDALEARKWEDIEEFVAKNDPWNHLLSCHNCFPMWDAFRKNITHLSIQSKAFWRLADLREKYHKPVVMDECCYEGNLSHFWEVSLDARCQEGSGVRFLWEPTVPTVRSSLTRSMRFSGGQREAA